LSSHLSSFLQDSSVPAETSTAGESSAPPLDDKSLRDRVKSLEQELRAAKACIAISKSKAERALANENRILDGVREAAEGLLCKKYRAPEPFFLIVESCVFACFD
jgi:hypothetical protein